MKSGSGKYFRFLHWLKLVSILKSFDYLRREKVNFSDFSGKSACPDCDVIPMKEVDYRVFRIAAPTWRSPLSGSR